MKYVIVPASVHHKAYTRVDPRTKKLNPELIEEAEEAIARYTGLSYKQINNCLRQIGVCSERTKKLIENMKHAFSIFGKETKQTLHVYRGTFKIGKLFGEEMPDNVKGIKITDKGFISTAVKKWIAKDFFAVGDLGWVLDIEIPKGTKIIDTRNIETLLSGGLDEQEIILLPGTLELIAKKGNTVTARYLSL